MDKEKFDQISENDLETTVGGRHRRDSDSWKTHLIEFGKGFLNSFGAVHNSTTKGEDEL